MNIRIRSRALLAFLGLVVVLTVGYGIVQGQLLGRYPIAQSSSAAIIDDTDLGIFRTTGSWTSIPLMRLGYKDAVRLSTNGTAEWMFVVTPGTYQIDVSVPVALRVSKQAYTVTDGVNALTNFVIDPASSQELDASLTSNWKQGATVTSKGGVIVVKLSTQGAVVVADAVRLTSVVVSASSSSTMSSSAPISSSSVAVCGNAIVESTEQCDFGAMNGQPCMAPAGTSCTYCSLACTTVIVSGTTASSASSVSAANPVCGNGKIEAGEQCDVGSSNGKICDSVMGNACTYCSTSCTKVVVNGQTGWSSSSIVAKEPVCGNGTIEGGEQCDEGSANGKICDSVMGGSCMYCSVSCIPVMVDGSRSSSAISSSSATTVGTCSDGIDNDADGGADIAFMTTATPTGSKRRSSFISFDSFKNTSYFMYQDESNGEQTIEARDASNTLVASRKFETVAIRRDVFGSPAIDSWTKMFTKPYYSDFTTANGESVYGLIADSTVATIAIGYASVPSSRTTKEAKVVRYSSDLSKIEAVLSTGEDRFQHGRLFATPDGKSLVLFAVGMIKRMEIPGAGNEFAAPFVLVIDPATFRVKARYAIDTNDLAVPYPLFIGNDKIVFAINRMKQPMYSVGMFVNVQRQSVQVIEFVPSTGAVRVVDQSYNMILGIPGDPRAVSDGTSAYITVANETTAPNGQRTQVPYLARIDLSTLSTAGLVLLQLDYPHSTRVIRTMLNGYVATLRTRYFPQTNMFDEEVLLYNASKIIGINAEQKAVIEEGSMFRSADGLLIRTNRSVPRSAYANYDQLSGAFYDYDTVSQSMVVRSLRFDQQCTGVLVPE